MAALKLVVAALCLCSAGPGNAAEPGDWSKPIAEASLRFGLPEDWIRRVIAVESGGRLVLNGRPVVSRAGAMGLMQVMPSTWSDLRATLLLGDDPFDPHDNIIAGSYYLRLLYDRFGYPGLFAAYNAGPGRFQRVLDGLDRLPAETRRYLELVDRGRTLDPHSSARRDFPEAAPASEPGLSPRTSRSGGALFALVADGSRH